MNNATPLIEPLFDDLPSLNLPNLPDTFLAENQQPEILDGEKFVVFFLDDEFFALPANRVAEVVRPLPVTSLPNSPEWLCGIANLRGTIISVFSLSQIFNKKSAPASLRTARRCRP